MLPPPDENHATHSAATSPFDGFGKVAKSVGQFVAPTTMVTAVLFYFGWAHVYWFFDYFGVDSTTLHPSIQCRCVRRPRVSSSGRSCSS